MYQKLLFKNKVAIGVEVSINNKKETYYANKEILIIGWFN